MIEAAFFDVDGTLLSFRTHKVPDSALRALDRLHRLGVKICISTGRAVTNLNEIAMVPYDGVIAMNGTDITLRDGLIVSHHAIPQDDFERMMEIAERRSLALAIESDEGVFVNRINDRVRELSRMVALPLPAIADLRKVFVAGSTCQLCLYADQSTETEVMSDFPTLAATRWCGIFADINVAGVDKGTGLREMARFWRIDPSATVAFGDGGNDIPMLHAAGIGIAMGNASDEVKSQAVFITGSVDDDGVDRALRRLGIVGD